MFAPDTEFCQFLTVWTAACCLPPQSSWDWKVWSCRSGGRSGTWGRRSGSPPWRTGWSSTLAGKCSRAAEPRWPPTVTPSSPGCLSLTAAFSTSPQSLCLRDVYFDSNFISVLTRETLSKISFPFELYWNRRLCLSQGVYKIDSSGHTFSVVLNWLRYRSLVLAGVEAGDVLPAADYFGLPELRLLLERRVRQENKKKSKMVASLERALEKVEEVFQSMDCAITGINEKLGEIKEEVSTFSGWRLTITLPCSGFLSGLGCGGHLES